MRAAGDIIETRLRNALAGKPIHFKDNEPGRKPAAVLIPFVFTDGTWHILFTRRARDVAKHQGEISFPGGAAESADGDLVDTAVREACEEIGVTKDKIQILGVLDPVPTVSNYCVLPVVSIIEWPQPLKLNGDEVETVFLIPIDWLKQEENWYEDDFLYEPGKRKAVIHYRDYHGEHLWGITARLAQIAISYI